MTSNEPLGTDGDAALLMFLEAQRACVFAVVEGLSDADLSRTVLPSGWSPIGLIEHLGHAERHWFQEVATAAASPLPWPDEFPAEPLTTRRTPTEVFAFYRSQVERSREVVAENPLSTPPRGRHGQGPPEETDIVDLRFVVLHMIEETARHLGHLDVARELLDGTTGLGPR